MKCRRPQRFSSNRVLERPPTFMFQPFEGTPNYPELEHSVLQLWDEQGTFDQLRAQTANGEPWRFQDGPITANNPMGVHHAWGRTYKDIFQRFYAMNGRKLRWQNGFDCQGLWVEVEVEKSLGFNGKPDILAFGMENFSRACRERVDTFANVIIEQSKRLGLWMDWERSYYTFDDSNIEHIWLFLKKCHEEGWLAQDYRVMPWCPRCETSLSQHESADSYKETTHKSVYVKFPVNYVGFGNPPHIQVQDNPFENMLASAFFLVWTTTPWTLVANVALAVNPLLTYVAVDVENDNATERFILAEGTLPTALKSGAKYKVVERFPGSQLVGSTYIGPFQDLEIQQRKDPQSSFRDPLRIVVEWADVKETEGTGIVHIAPSCGAEDFELVGQTHGFIVPVNHAARFVAGTGELEGLHALEDVDTVLKELQEKRQPYPSPDEYKFVPFYRRQMYPHSYPHCWRCSHELIFNAVQEWFIKADAGERPARERLRIAARTVKWIPDYAGLRMDDWLSKMGDWCISRKRFWGLPLPFYLDRETGEVEVIGSRQELRERAVDPAMVDALPELHRPWIDGIEIRSRDGLRVLERVPEVGDAWLDAGIVPFSTVGFNGATDLRMPEQRIDGENAWQPADFITEMREQVRLWFFSMLFMSVALEDRAPYKTAMVYETMLDQEGERISKTKKNGVPYDEAVETVGADPMRWTFCSNPLNKDIRFGYSPIHESARKLLTLWNVYGFFVKYANLDKPDLTIEYSKPANILDKWILARLQTLIADVTSAVEQVRPSDVTRSVEEFVDELSNWYVRRSRRRFWKKNEAEGGDEDKISAYQTLHRVLVTLTQLVAPVIPFTAETMYQNLKTSMAEAPQSVHLCAWPQVDAMLKNDELTREVESVLSCVSLGHKARKESEIKVRQPLRRVLIQAPTNEARVWIANWRETILDELNVKEIELLDDAGALVEYSLKANLPKLGKKLGKQMGAARQAFEGASPEDARRIGEASKKGESFTLVVGGEEMTFAGDEVLVQSHQKGGYSFAQENGWAVALDTTLDEKLIEEGLARDFVRAIQQARKDSGLEISDRIAILLVEPSDESAMPQVFENWGDYVQSETLADELRLVADDYPELLDAKVGDETVRFRVEKMPDEAITF
jgi:isoleucyl-tRNA synthetase